VVPACPAACPSGRRRPRAGGVGPAVEQAQDETKQSSPRRRGWFPHVRPRRTIRSIVPEQTGLVRSTGRWSSRPHFHPAQTRRPSGGRNANVVQAPSICRRGRSRMCSSATLPISRPRVRRTGLLYDVKMRLAEPSPPRTRTPGPLIAPIFSPLPQQPTTATPAPPRLIQGPSRTLRGPTNQLHVRARTTDR
jgi:hypothetical protein